MPLAIRAKKRAQNLPATDGFLKNWGRTRQNHWREELAHVESIGVCSTASVSIGVWAAVYWIHRRRFKRRSALQGAIIVSQQNGNSSAEQYAAAKREIDRRYPAGQFVAIEDGQAVADAETHRMLVEKLQAQGQNPKGLLIVQAGVDYPRSAIIFFGR
jgi:hypothetical protein